MQSDYRLPPHQPPLPRRLPPPGFLPDYATHDRRKETPPCALNPSPYPMT